MPTKPKRPQHEIDKAVEAYLSGENVNSLAKRYKMSRAGMYLWIRKAREDAAAAAHRLDVGSKGIEQEKKISDRLKVKGLEQENRELKQKLFELLVKHKEL